jgi:iron complex outermembrane receptor protein
MTPIPAAAGVKAKATKPSYKVSLSYKPSSSLTTYATVSTGFRTPVVNAFAGRPSVVNPNDLTIPYGASSDDLTNYEVGAKGRWSSTARSAPTWRPI